MLIRITRAGTAMLADAKDFGRFSIRFDAGARGTGIAEAALRRIATPDGDAAWVAPEALRDMAPDAGDPEWEAGLARMIAFARDHGWVNAEGRIRAHIA